MTESRTGKRTDFWWRLPVWVVAILVLVPLLTLMRSFITGVDASGTMAHIVSTSGWSIFLNTTLLLFGVVALTAVMGVIPALLIALTDLPGRNILRLLMLSPLAIPAYVTGFVYCGLLDYAGPLQSLVRDIFGEQAGAGISARNLGGAVLVLSLALYPYVYLITLTALMTQGHRAVDAASSCGVGGVPALRRAVLPMARPWINGALVVVAMETLADFGTVSLFMTETLTTAVYKAWYGFFSPETAARLSAFLVLIALGILMLRSRAERRKSYTAVGSLYGSARLLKVSGVVRYGGLFFCWLLVMFGFAVPAVQVAVWAVRRYQIFFEYDFAAVVGNTVVIGVLVAGLIGAVSVFMSSAGRFVQTRDVRFAEWLAQLGYALPGGVLAIGFFIPVSAFDHRLTDAVEKLTGLSLPLLFTGTVALTVLGLFIRFFAIGHAAIGSGLRRVTLRIDDAAASLGAARTRVFRRIHLPLLLRVAVPGLVLAFIDIIKEMPLTLMTRPFGYDTLSIRIFQYTSEGDWERAAVPAVLLILTGLISVLLLARSLVPESGQPSGAAAITGRGGGHAGT